MVIFRSLNWGNKMNAANVKNMRKILVRVIVLLFFGSAVYFGYSLYLRMTAKLTVPTEPPAFSVSYLYYFSSGSPLDIAKQNTEVETDIENIKKAGFKGIKLNFYFRRNNLISDSITQAAAKKGLYPIGQLVGHDQKPKDRAFTDQELTEWEKFVREEVRKNRNLIYYWEIWNEPSMTELRFRYGTPAEYLELLKRTQKIINEENPAAKIIVTVDLTDREAEKFTTEFFDLGGADYFDYLSFHPYNAIDPKARYDLSQTMNQEKVLSEKYNKPLWITEIGVPDSDSDEAHQADIALALYKTAYENKIPIVWFHWSDRRISSVDGKTGWGLVREDNTFKPSYEAIKSFIEECEKR
ncbi:MAG: Cellulase (glycosyl hydrolase family 5) [Pelotomaculum sp. PtaU1.Bin065]|jgi:hypothetical protein|nr:MAG: Cellulase (glycosyl hydrolase family 5) [Pelotomaculum sp. PtaU1.Bin065]